jgi:hypothetical protein
MPTAVAISVAEHLKRIPPVARPIVQAARRTVKSVAPTAKEIAYNTSRPLGAKSPSMYKISRYVVDDVQVAGVGTFPRYAVVFFSRGNELDNESGLLQGSGRARFVRLRTVQDAERPAVKRMIREAFKLTRGN